MFKALGATLFAFTTLFHGGTTSTTAVQPNNFKMATNTVEQRFQASTSLATSSDKLFKLNISSSTATSSRTFQKTAVKPGNRIFQATSSPVEYKPSPKPIVVEPTPTPKPTPTPVAVPTEPIHTYINTYGNEVQSPTHYNTAPAGASARCGDGSYSFSQSRRGTCSHHGGVAEWL